MKNIFQFLILILLFSCSKNDDTSQPDAKFQGEVVWSKSFGGSSDEKITSVVSTIDGGYIVLGYTDSQDNGLPASKGMLDIWLSKFDSSGNLIWTKTIGGSLNDYGTSIAKTNDGNFIIAGYTESLDGDVPGNVGLHDFLITKINQNGNVIWSKNYGFISHDHAHTIIQLSNGDYFVAGFANYDGILGTPGDGNHGEGHSLKTNNTLHGTGEYFGIRLDANGNFKWYRYFGGTQNDRVNDVLETNDGGILLVGYSESNNFDVTNNKGSYDFWVLKLDFEGHLHWKQNYGGSGIDQAFSVVKTDYNSYIIAGRSNSADKDISNPLGGFDGWIIHIDDMGKLLWNKNLGTNQFDGINAIKNLNNGNFGIVGNTRGSLPGLQNFGENDFWFLEVDVQPNSNILFQKNFGGENIDMATDFIQTENNEIIIVGESQSNSNHAISNNGFNDMLILKFK